MDNGVNIFFIILIPVLLFMYLHQRKQIQRINEVIEAIQQGKTNQRFQVQTVGKTMRQLSINLNIILDQMEMTVERSRYFEEAWHEMLSNLASDLYIPLNDMLGYLEVLLTDPKLTPEERQEFVKLIARKGDQLSARLDNFRGLAWGETDDPSGRCG